MCFRAEWGNRPSGNRGRKIKKSQLAKGDSESKAKRVGRAPLAGEAPQQSGRGAPRKKSGKRCAVHSADPCCQKGSCPRAGTKRGESRRGGARLPAAGKRPPNSRPLQTSAAKPQKGGGAPRPSRGRLRPSGQCEHVLHAREKKQAYGLVPAEGKKQVGTKRTLSWRRKPLASRIAAGCHRKESPHKVGSAAEALWARLRTAVASAALFGKEERRRTPTTFLREKSPQTAEGPRRCRRC